jgi:hypothetical protein
VPISRVVGRKDISIIATRAVGVAVTLYCVSEGLAERLQASRDNVCSSQLLRRLVVLTP